MFPSPPLTPFVRVLLGGLFGAFVVQLVLERIVGIPVLELLAISSSLPLDVSAAWRVVTHVLVNESSPGGVVMMLVGLLFLWWAGSPFELRFGSRETAVISAIATVASGLATLAATLVLPGASLGAGPILIALIVAYAVTLPPRAQLRFFGAIPLTPRGLVWVLLGFVALMALASGNWAGLVGDLATTGAAVLYVRWLTRPRMPRPSGPSRRPASRGRFQVIRGGASPSDDDDDDRPKYLN